MSAVERQRRYRARQRECEAIAPFVTNVDRTELLIACGFLRGDQDGDREAIGLAAGALFDALIEAGAMTVLSIITAQRKSTDVSTNLSSAFNSRRRSDDGITN